MSKEKHINNAFATSHSARSKKGFLTIDQNLLITSWDSQLEGWLHISQTEARGKNIYEILSSIEDDKIRILINKPFYEQEIATEVVNFDHNIKKRFYIKSMPLLTHDGEQNGVQLLLQLNNDDTADSPSLSNTDTLSLLHPLLNQFVEGVFIIDQQGKFVQINQAGLRELGYTEQELLHLRFNDLLHSEDYHNQPLSPNNLNSNQTYVREYRILTKEGHTKYLESTIHLLESGYIQIVTRDISNRKETEQYLQHSEEQYRLLFDSNPQPIIIYDANSCDMLDANHSACELYGYSKQAFTNLTIDQIRPEEERDVFNNFFENLTDDSVNMGEWTHCKSDGTLFQVRVTSYALHMQGRKVRISMINDITEKKETEKSLQESEEKFEALTESSLVGIYMFQGETFDYINPSLAKMFGYEPEEVIGQKGPEDFIHADDWPLVQNKIHQLFSDQLISENITFRTLTKENNVRHLEAFATTIQFRSQKVLTGTAIDVTERKKAEEELIYNKELLQNVYDQSQDALFIIRAEDEVIEDCNPMAVEMFKMDSKQELIGQSIFSLKSEELNFTQEQLDQVKQQVSEGKQWSTEFLLETKDKQQFWGSIVIKRFRINERLKSLVRITDIDEKMRNKQKLIEEQQFVQAITQNTPNIIQLYDVTKDAYVYANRNLQEFLGYTTDELNQFENGVLELFAEEDIPILKERLNENLTLNDGQVQTNEFRIQHKDGYWVWLLAYDTVFTRDENGNVQQILGTLQDITERKNAELKLANFNEELEKEVQERTRQLENANKELEAFNYTVSHDLRNPLRAIEIFSSFLEKKYYEAIDDKGKEYIDQIRTSVRNITQLLDDLLAFSRIGRKEKTEEEFDMTVLFQEVIQEHRYYYEDNPNPSIVLHNLHNVIGDRQMLRHVSMNLIANAMKFTKHEQSPEITIGSYQENHRIVFYVSDNGVGFDMTYVDKIFGVFERLHTENEFEGTGGGLSIVERVIQRHNGSIWAEGEKGNGATFYFSLPTTSNQ